MTASAPSVPTGLASANATASAFDLSWNKSNNPSALKNGSWTGVAYGSTGSYPAILTHESNINRAVAIFRNYCFASGQPGDAILTADDRAMAFGGTLSSGQSTKFNGATVQRVAYMNMVPWLRGASPLASLWGGSPPVPGASDADFGGAGHNNVWTPTQVGQCDINGNITVTGVINPLIDQWAAACAAFPGPTFFNWNHESDVLPLGGKGGPWWRSAYTGAATSSSTQAQRLAVAAAHRYVIKRIRKYYSDRSLTLNVIFPWVASDWRGSPNNTYYQDTYPGSGWCDWIGWDPYDHAGSGASAPPGGSAGTMAAMFDDNSWYTTLEQDPFETKWSATTAVALNAIVVPNVTITGLVSTWSASHTYSVGDTVVPVTQNGHVYQCTTGGTSNSSEPTWSTTDGATGITDSAVRWKELAGYGHFYTCTTAGTTGGSAPTWPSASGATVSDGSAVWKESGLSSSGKPRMLGEVGAAYRTNGSRTSICFAGTSGGFVASAKKYPRMKAITYFGPQDRSSSWSGLFKSDGTPDDAANNAMASSTTGLNNAIYKPDTTVGGSGVGGYRIYDNGTQISSVSGDPASPVTKHLSGLASGAHPMQVTAIDTSGSPLESQKSVVLTVTLGTPPPPPAAPVMLTPIAAAVAPQATLPFTGPGAGGTRIYRSDDGGSTWVLKYTAAAGVASITTNDLAASPSPAYQFKGRALDATGQVESADSNIVSFAGVINNPQPLPVSNLTGVQVTSAGATNNVLTWTLPADPNRAFVGIYVDADPNASGSGAQPVTLLGANAVTWTDQGVPPSTSHTYYVVPTSGAAVLAPSVSIAETTPTAQVNAILSVTPQGATLVGDGTPAVFTLDASASTDSLGLPLKFTFSVNDGAPAVGPLDSTGNPIGPIQPRSELSPGNYTASVLVANSQGLTATDSVPFTVAPAQGNGTPYLNLQQLTNNIPFGPPSITTGTVWDVLNTWAQTLDSWSQSIGSGGTIPYWQPVSGEYVWIDGLQGWVNTQLAAGSHQVQQWTRLKIPTNTAFSAVGLNVTTGGTGGTQAATFSLYADDGTGRNPGAWIQNSASVSLLSTGWQEDAAFSYTSGGVPGRYMYVWVSSTLTLTSVGTYATVSMVNNAPMLPGIAGAFLNRGLAQSSVSSPVNPVVLGSLTRTATPILVGLKLA